MWKYNNYKNSDTPPLPVRKKYVIFSLLSVLLLTSCAAMEDQSNAQPSYESTKKMMVDMLKTDEGKEAIKEVLQDEEVKQELVMEEAFVRETVQNTLTSDAGKEYWKSLMQDPEFAKAFAESMQQENEQILKNLMKDPEYQGMMISVMKDPEMEEEYLEIMQSKEYRQQVLNVMSDAFESPYFVAKLNEIMANVAEKQMEKQDKDKENETKEGNGEEEEE